MSVKASTWGADAAKPSCGDAVLQRDCSRCGLDPTLIGLSDSLSPLAGMFLAIFASMLGTFAGQLTLFSDDSICAGQKDAKTLESGSSHQHV
jgi:hypothetical protein